MDNCSYCENEAKFDCVDCGKRLCEEHATVMKVRGENKIVRRCSECLKVYRKNIKDQIKERRKYFQYSFPYIRYTMIALVIMVPLAILLWFLM